MIDRSLLQVGNVILRLEDFTECEVTNLNYYRIEVKSLDEGIFIEIPPEEYYQYDYGGW